MKVYITKYALTSGIKESEASQTSTPGLIRTMKEEWPSYFSQKDWCADRASAIQQANSMRDKKIESLKKQIKKLEALKFE